MVTANVGLASSQLSGVANRVLVAVSYKHLRAHETREEIELRLKI